MLSYSFVLPQALNDIWDGEIEELVPSYSVLGNKHVLSINQGCEDFGIENRLIDALINSFIQEICVEYLRSTKESKNI